jgi:hypothetical protein
MSMRCKDHGHNLRKGNVYEWRQLRISAHCLKITTSHHLERTYTACSTGPRQSKGPRLRTSQRTRSALSGCEILVLPTIRQRRHLRYCPEREDTGIEVKSICCRQFTTLRQGGDSWFRSSATITPSGAEGKDVKSGRRLRGARTWMRLREASVRTVGRKA